MPITVKDSLPAIDALKKENVFVMSSSRAQHQDIRPLKLAILNLMPNKVATEIQLIRLLANTPLQADIDLLRLDHHQSKHTSQLHLNTFYQYFSDIREQSYDGLIITGAPLGLVEYEDVTYWSQLEEIMDWANEHVTSTLFLCWAAHAALYHHYGVERDIRAEKLSGLYLHQYYQSNDCLTRGFDDEFWVPHSRYAQVKNTQLERHECIDVLAGSDCVGAYLLKRKDGRQVFVTGHPEYDLCTLSDEYKRDKDAGLNPVIPVNYYPHDDVNLAPNQKWQSHANLLFSNWLNYYVYQTTPHDITTIPHVNAQGNKTFHSVAQKQSASPVTVAKELQFEIENNQHV